jgi:hypothetical protein
MPTHLCPPEPGFDRRAADAVFGALLSTDPDPAPSRLPAVSVIRKFSAYSGALAADLAADYAAADPMLNLSLDFRAHRLSDRRWGVTRRVLPGDGDGSCRLALHLPTEHTFRLDGGALVTLPAVDGWGGDGRPACTSVDDITLYVQERTSAPSFSWDVQPPDLLALVEQEPHTGERAQGFRFAVRVSQVDGSYRRLGAVRWHGAA